MRPSLYLAPSVLAAVVAAAGAGVPGRGPLPDEQEGFAGVAAAVERHPTVAAAFARESYPRGAVARLVVHGRARRASVQLFRSGPEEELTRGKRTMLGVRVDGSAGYEGPLRPGQTIRIPVPSSESGLYFVRIEAADGRVGFAPLIVRPRALGEHRVAVVLPTNTWQAYNFRDDDGDGRADTWYAGWRTREVRLDRPFVHRGVPPHFRRYDLPFLRWLAVSGRSADFFSDRDLGRVRSGRRLARAYSLIVFPGHHEYVTRREYDVVTAFRNAGGNLAFLSANNFFWQVEIRGNVMRRVARWRDLGRPEAALVGVQYRANDGGRRRGPWIVRRPEAAPWLFEGTALTAGSAFSTGGIEIDAVAPSSPRGVRVLAEIPNLFGRGYTAQMTYYETRAGARVFAAGAFSLASSLWLTVGRRLVANLWDELGGDLDRISTAGADARDACTPECSDE